MIMSTMPKSIQRLIALADAASWSCAIIMLALLLLGTATKDDLHNISFTKGMISDGDVKGKQLLDRPCDEIYVVGEGETLHTISDKCDDPFIVEQNPHIHDPDDVFPGLVIKITPKPSKII